MTGMTPTAHEFEVLLSLAAMAGLAPERVAALQRRWQIEPENRPGAPYVLLFGAGDAMRHVIAALAGADAAQRVAASNAAVAVVGREPDRVRPLATVWPHIESKAAPMPALIVLRAADRIPAATLEALASLGTIDRAILATRLTQPMNQDERHLARTLGQVAETLQVVLAGLPGEEIDEGEAGEVLAYAAVQAEAAGFKGTRFAGAHFWLPGGGRGLPGELAEPKELLQIEEGEIGRNREAVLAAALVSLIGEIDKGLAAGATPQRPIAVSEADIEKLIAQFGGHVKSLARDVKHLILDGDLRDTQDARAFISDRIANWINGQTLPSATLTMAETFRPGIKARLAAASAEAVRSIEVEAARPKPQRESAEQAAAFGFLARRGWARAIVAAGIGVLVAYAAQLFIPLVPWQADEVMQRLAALALGGLTGVAAFFVLSQPWVIGRGEPPRDAASPPVNPLKGWPLAEEKLLAAFSSHMRDVSGEAARKTLQDLKQRFTKESPA